jgi:hypothetical protein
MFRKFCPHALNQRSPAEGKGKGRAASDLLGLQPVLEPHTKVQLLIFKAKIIKKGKMSKKMMIFYSFPFNFLWKSLMTLMTMTLMTGFLSFLYPMQLVTPSVVAIAVSMLMAI